MIEQKISYTDKDVAELIAAVAINYILNAVLTDAHVKSLYQLECLGHDIEKLLGNLGEGNLFATYRSKCQIAKPAEVVTQTMPVITEEVVPSTEHFSPIIQAYMARLEFFVYGIPINRIDGDYKVKIRLNTQGSYKKEKKRKLTDFREKCKAEDVVSRLKMDPDLFESYDRLIIKLLAQQL
jgi:hypothetical protein